MPREDVANDRQSSMPTILEDCRNIPVVEDDLVAFVANIWYVGESFLSSFESKDQIVKIGS